MDISKLSYSSPRTKHPLCNFMHNNVCIMFLVNLLTCIIDTCLKISDDHCPLIQENIPVKSHHDSMEIVFSIHHMIF